MLPLPHSSSGTEQVKNPVFFYPKIKQNLMSHKL